MSKKLRVTDLYLNGSSPQSSYLDEIITDTTNVGNQIYLFSEVFMPVRKYDATAGKLSDEYEYVNVGLTTTELTDLYWTLYSGASLIGAGCGKDLNTDILLLKKRCKAVFNKNYGKYLKLIEMNGLEWNPLWNVDGTEIRQILENQGVNDVLSGPQDSTTTEHQVSAYDSGLKSEWKDIQTGKVETTYTHNNAKNGEADYTVDAGDTAFGYALTGGDKMHIEKYLRQGNIGVTKTTELLEDARNYMRFSVVQEFFNDINKVILIGTYDY